MGDRPVTRLGDKSTGHGPYIPRASTGSAGSVYANNILVHRATDGWDPHTASPAYNGDPHPGEAGTTTLSGSGTVYAENEQLARIGDPLDDGDTIAAGSPDVFAG